MLQKRVKFFFEMGTVITILHQSSIDLPHIQKNRNLWCLFQILLSNCFCVFVVVVVVFIFLIVLLRCPLVLSGICNFQTGRCGLKPDKNATFQWTVGSGQTLTERTGPSYDHTSFSEDGKTVLEQKSLQPGKLQ